MGDGQVISLSFPLFGGRVYIVMRVSCTYRLLIMYTPVIPDVGWVGGYALWMGIYEHGDNVKLWFFKFRGKLTRHKIFNICLLTYLVFSTISIVNSPSTFFTLGFYRFDVTHHSQECPITIWTCGTNNACTFIEIWEYVAYR